MPNVNLRDVEPVRLGRDRHCFALQGDLGLLDADVYLVPTDSYGSVEDHWKWAVGVDERGQTRQLHEEAALLVVGGFAWVDGAPAGSILALDVAGSTTANEVAPMIRRLSAALQSIESRGLVSTFRARPLVAMPLIGVGGAGLGGRTGEVISALLGAVGDHFDQSPAGAASDSSPERAQAGTVVLTASDPARVRLLQRSFCVVEGDNDRGILESARDVDVLLDWVAMQTSSDLSFALDSRYRAILSPADQALAATLSALAGAGAWESSPESELRQSLGTYLRLLGIER